MKSININKKLNRAKRHYRFVKKLEINENSRPRLIVTRTNKNIIAQVLEPITNNVLAYSSTINLKVKGNIDSAKTIGAEIAQKSIEKGIKEVVFDRNGQKFHGQIKAVAEAAREKGLNF